MVFVDGRPAVDAKLISRMNRRRAARSVREGTGIVLVLIVIAVFLAEPLRSPMTGVALMASGLLLAWLGDASDSDSMP